MKIDISKMVEIQGMMKTKSNKYITILGFNPDDPFINDSFVLETLINRSSEQLETDIENLFWVIDCFGFKSLKIRKSNIATERDLSDLEIENRLATMQGFFWGITYPR